MEKNPVKTILSGAKSLFAASLIIYLAGFLLEIVLPGFISNNFNLNWILGIVLLLGLLAAFSEEETEEKEVEKPKKSDYWLFIGLGIIGGLLMFYRSDLNLVPRILFSLFVAIFITAISLFLLLNKDEESPEPEESESAEAIHAATTPVWPQIRRFMAKPISLPAGAWVILVILLGLSFFRPVKETEKETDKTQVIVDETSGNELKGPAVAPFLAQEFSYIPSLPPTDQELAEALISVLNGNTQVGSASAMAIYLRGRGFKIKNIVDADRHDYQNAIVRFKPEQQVVANYLIQVINNIYPKVEAAPSATDSGEIILILGNL